MEDANPISAEAEYTKILDQIGTVSDELLEALKSNEGAKVDRLLESREELFRMAREHSRPPDQGSSHSQELMRRLAEQQAQCERALDARILECREALTALRNGRGLKAAYRACGQVNSPRFMDSRL